VKWLLVRLGPPARAVRGVVGNRDLRRAELAFLGFNVAEPATWIAILVYAFDRGGTAETGIMTLVLLTPAAVFAPVAAGFGDRRRRDRVVAFGYTSQAVTTGATGAAMLADAPALVVYAIATVAMATYTTGRPGHHSLLPNLARSPDELAAANSVSSLAEGVGGTAGTACISVLLAVAPVGVSYVVMAAITGAAALLAFSVRTEHVATEPGADQERRRPWSFATDAIAGLVAITRVRGAAVLLVVAAAVALVWGTFDVLVVTLAFDRLGIGAGGVGALHTAIAVGVLLGAAGSVALVGRSRIVPALVAGAVVLGASIAALGFGESVALAAVATGATGAATTVLDVAGRTLLQRVVDDSLLTRVFGAIESLWMIGFGVGGPIAAALVSLFDLRAAFVVTSAVVPVIALLGYRALARLERQAAVPARQLELVSRLAMFAPLPRTDLERVARQLDRVDVASGTEVIRQGDVGDRFYVVEEGSFEVVADGRVLSTMTEGDHFGEIALLHDVLRTATVRAATDGVVWALDQEEFLATVTGMPQAKTLAHEISAERLRAGSRRRGIG
jgi:Cyclic nucleotide-binding domain/Major Facilitator Superfamily